jgi:hypothetical protein
MSTLRWKHNKKNTDDTNFDPTRFFGWDLAVDGVVVLNVPAGWELDGEYVAEIGDIKQGLSEGEHAVTMRLNAKDDFEDSDWSAPYTLVVEKRKPTPPFDLAVS